MYQSWEKGQQIFEEYLLDADWSLNAANWQWLSASTFFHQYWKCYSPIEFGKKTDKNGDYIRKYLPVFKKFPSQYIYEPWMAPPNVQQAANCIIGKDYPKAIVDHKIVSKTNMARMKIAFELHTASKSAAQSSSPQKKPVVTIKKESQSPVPSTSSSIGQTKKTQSTNKSIKKELVEKINLTKSVPLVRSAATIASPEPDDQKKAQQPPKKKAKIDQFFKSNKKSS